MNKFQINDKVKYYRHFSESFWFIPPKPNGDGTIIGIDDKETYLVHWDGSWTRLWVAGKNLVKSK